MAIPTNLIPINVDNPLRETPISSLETPLVSSINGVPSNLIAINTSDIANLSQSIAGAIPSIDVGEIPDVSILSTIIPDRLFETGSYDTIRSRAISGSQTFINGLPQPIEVPTIPALTVPFPPPRPSFGQIKDYIETKIDRIKRERQKASIKALKAKLKKKENPFTYRQELINTNQRQILDNKLTNQ